MSYHVVHDGKDEDESWEVIRAMAKNQKGIGKVQVSALTMAGVTSTQDVLDACAPSNREADKTTATTTTTATTATPTTATTTAATTTTPTPTSAPTCEAKAKKAKEEKAKVKEAKSDSLCSSSSSSSTTTVTTVTTTTTATNKAKASGPTTEYLPNDANELVPHTHVEAWLNGQWTHVEIIKRYVGDKGEKLRLVFQDSTSSARWVPINDNHFRCLGGGLEKCPGELIRDAEWSAALKYVSDRLFECKKESGDGNCLYRVVARFLDGDPEKHAKCRQDAYTYLRDNSNRFDAFRDSEIELQIGCSLELQILCEMHKFTAVVHDYKDKSATVTRLGVSTGSLGGFNFLLCRGHYDSLCPRETLDDAKKDHLLL